MGAAYDFQERSPPQCLPGTREQVLEEIDAWIKAGAKGRPVLWLRGLVGAGKLAIADRRRDVETCAGRNELAANFISLGQLRIATKLSTSFRPLPFRLSFRHQKNSARSSAVIHTLLSGPRAPLT